MDRPPDIDRKLASRARDGDLEAYAELVKRYEEVAFRVAWLICRSASDAEDATQEAFIKAYRAIDRLRVDASFRPWLLQIVANEARNRVRAAVRRTRYETLAATAAAGAVPSAEAEAVDAVHRDKLRAAIDRLPDRERLIVACRYLLELSEAETAAVAGIPKGTAKSRLARAIDRMREDLAEAES